MIRVSAGVSNRAKVAALLLAAIACGGLGGCGGEAGAAIAPDNRPLAEAPAPDLMFTMADGTRLPARQWLPPAGTPWRGVILALHGFSDSRDGWSIPAPGFAAAGYAMFAPDQRGFGATATRGTWAGTDTMVGDAEQILGQLRARYPGQRLILMGESMGGAIAMCVNARDPHAMDDTILLAPAVWGRAQMSPVLTGSLWLADGIAPHWNFTGREIPIDIAPTDNREALLALARDPLTMRASNVAMLAGLVNLMDAAQAAAPHLQGPVLILDGRRDQVVPPSATAVAWAKLPPGVRRAFYLDGYHMLLRDHDRALVEADILSWLADPGRWLPSGADVNAAAWQADHGYGGTPAGVLPAEALDGAGERSTWPF
jgi:alpha-beta hydrolase superfamily lysophospholipase